jgi:tetratricopeptide (TPR) repeat protein
MIESFNKKELEEKIDQYVNGQLSAQEVDELWAELIQDGYHLDYLKSVANLKAVIKRKREEQKKAKKKQYWYYAAAAVIALLIAIVGVMNISTQQQSSVEPVSTIELDYYRSGDGTVSSSPDKEVIQNAIKLANTGRENEAITLLQAELENASTPEWIVELSLNLGSLHYNNGNYDKAIEYYERVITHKDNENVDVLMLEKAYWYIGNAYFHLDQLVDAKTNIEKAHELNGAYRRVAQSYLNALSE